MDSMVCFIAVFAEMAKGVRVIVGRAMVPVSRWSLMLQMD
jgi:hypothetical protein